MAIAGVLALNAPAFGEEVYPGVVVPDDVYKTEYGDKENYSEIKYYKWTTNEAGAKVLVEGTSNDNDLKYYVSSKKDTVSDISGVIAENQNGGDINTNFVDLVLDSNTNAIKNAIGSEIGNITSDIVNSGGNVFISSQGDINNINLTAINNTGRLIYTDTKDAKISNITGTFIGNSNDKGLSLISTFGPVQSIKGTFIGNSMTGNNVWGTVIRNSSSADSYIGSIEGVFIDNYNSSRGGAIANAGVMDSIKGIFIGNRADSEGSAIWHYGIVNTIDGYFERNTGSYAILAYLRNSLLGDRKYNINSIKGVFIENDGAIHNAGEKIGKIEGVFKDNHVVSRGGAILNLASGAMINEITNSTFHNNYVSGDSVLGGGAIYFGRTLNTIQNCDFNGNYVDALSSDALGGAIRDNNADKTSTEIINSNFLNNYAKTSNGTGKGGAIYSINDINIVSDGKVSSFIGNYTESQGVRDDNAIYLSKADGVVNFQLKNGGSIVMKDNIRGMDGYGVNIQGDNIDKTVFYMHNDMYNANLRVGNTTLNTINDDVHTYELNSFTLTDNVKMTADVNLATNEMDRFTANSYGDHGNNKLSVIGMNIVKDAPSASAPVEILFAEAGLKDNVSNGELKLPDNNYQTTAYSPIYKYNVTYDNRTDGGYFVFAQGGLNGGNKSDNFNPAVLASPVGTQAVSNATVNETFKYVFEYADTFTQMPISERIGAIKRDQYALSTDYNNNLGILDTEFNNKAGWFRPYVTFENMDLKNGPKVDAITYGSLAGFDSDFQHFKNGWTGVTTGYIGYNGSQLSYSGVDTTVNGGILGLTQTMYKGNFWTALTVSAGASVGENSTMYGKEDFTTLLAGVGSKTGYNFEFKEGRFIFQPIMFMSYTFANTFDYTNAAGVKINNDPMHSILLNPSVRFIANTKNGWQPYLSVGMVWNVMNESGVTANNVKLPEMKMKPYVEYGLGIQKRFKDNFTAFGQAMIRNGGRNGIALTSGLRWNIGRTNKHIERVHNKKVIKQAKI